MEVRSCIDQRAKPTVVTATEGEASRTIEGYALLFEHESRMMFDCWKGQKFIEIIKRGAIVQSDIANYDVKAVYDHEGGLSLLARSFMGKGTLSLNVDEVGLHYRFEAPNTNAGNTAIELIKRGDIFGSSFKFSNDAKGVKYSKRDDGIMLREVTRINGLYDISPVIDPAYFGTDVTVRDLSEFMPPPEPPTPSAEELAAHNAIVKQQVDELRQLAKR